MFEPQHFVDLQDNSAFGDANSWLTGEDNSSPTQRRTQPSLGNPGTTNSNVDRVLFKDLVEIVPLVQSLIVSIKFCFFFSKFCQDAFFFFFFGEKENKEHGLNLDRIEKRAAHLRGVVR